MLSPAAFSLADRLSMALMALLESVATFADRAAAGTRMPYAEHAGSLLTRLIDVVTRLASIDPRSRPRPGMDPAPRPQPAAAKARRRPSHGLPRRAFWIVEALPETAPALVADLRALLADPALAELLAAAPGIRRALGPILRGLGLGPSGSPSSGSSSSGSPARTPAKTPAPTPPVTAETRRAPRPAAGPGSNPATPREKPRRAA